MTAPTRSRLAQASPRLAAKAAAARSARRRRLAARTGIGLAVLAPLGLLAWLLLASPLLVVRVVTVSGTSRLTAAQVRAAAGVVLGTPLARVDTAAVGRRVAELPPVAQVHVTRQWPGTLRVRVVERRPAVGVLGPTGFTLLDGTGVPFASVPTLPPGVVRLQVPTPGRADPTTRSALQVLAELAAPLRDQVRIVRAASPSGVTLLLADGRQVIWGGAGNAAVKAEAIAVLLRMPGRVFDVSRPDVVTRR